MPTALRGHGGPAFVSLCLAHAKPWAWHPAATMGSLSEASPAVRPTRVRFRVLGWLCSLSMITYIDRVCIMQVQGEMQDDLGLSKEQFAWAFSAFALAYALFEVPTGWLGDLLGPRKVLIRIVLCWLLFTALTGLAWG